MPPLEGPDRVLSPLRGGRVSVTRTKEDSGTETDPMLARSSARCGKGAFRAAEPRSR